jgi:hypothetical protein
MDNEEAKFLLRAYRPGGADASDPTFANALAQTRQDPALGKWFAEEQALDRAVAAQLQTLRLPAGLRESILAGGKISRSARRGWQQPSWLAVAALIALVLGLSSLWSISYRHREIDHLAAFAIDDVLHGQHGNRGEANAQLRTVLENNSVRLSTTTMPVNFADLESTGCRSLKFSGHEIAEICFSRGGRGYHLYVMSRLSDLPARPRFWNQQEGAAAAWSDSRNSYVLATAENLANLQQLL